MPQNLLTDAKVRSAKPREKPYKLSDGGNLHLLVAPTGLMAWRWRFRLGGKENVFAVGTFPSMGLAEARKARDAARALVDKGLNPAHQRHEEERQNLAEAEARRRDAEGAFAKVAAAWLAAGKWTAGTHRQKASRVERHVLPALGGLPITQIGAAQIRPVLEGCRDGGAWAAVRVKGDLSQIFDHAVAHGLVDANPVPGLRALVHAPQSESKAALTLPQLREFFSKLRAYRGYPETAMCLRLMALTACRPGEVADAEWSEFDFEARLWRRPAEKMKARREHVFPLSTQALGVLEQLRGITGGGRYLFPHRDNPTGFTTTWRLRYLMRDLDIAKGASPHCWRTTFSTWANENGHRPDAIEKQLAHVESNKVRATYNKALLVEERRQIMQAWGDYLAMAEADNVVPLRPKAASPAG
ncbi:MAG: integrase arm-type DNA-binding domain-containing protein [Polyangia bacterium]|jgi:integrase